MVNKCVVVGCNTNYETMRKKTKRDADGNVLTFSVDAVTVDDNNKISSFHFPTDEKHKQKWIKFVCRGNDYLPSKNSVICSTHFEDKFFIKREKRIRLNFSLEPIPTIYPKDFVPQSSLLPSASSQQQRKSPKYRRLPD